MILNTASQGGLGFLFTQSCYFIAAESLDLVMPQFKLVGELIKKENLTENQVLSLS